MHPDFALMFYKAEDHYLSDVDLKVFKHHTESLKQRLALYETLREQELEIWQPVADRLQQAFPTESDASLEQILRQGIALFRYGAMAMLLHNPEFLQRRLLEWLTDVVASRQSQALMTKLNELLQARLKEMLTDKEVDLIIPFLDQAQVTLVGTPPVVTVQ